MDSVSPVHTEEFEELERVIALDQKEYFPIIILDVHYSNGVDGAMVRFRFSDEERKKIAEGADLVVSELTFGKAFTPISLSIQKQGEFEDGR